ncbi:MAG: aldehyde dehydrogenase family protein [Phycisphaerae bacterium]
MSRLSDRQVDEIARRVLATLSGGGAAAAAPVATGATARPPADLPAWPAGIHPNIDAAVQAARAAFVEFGRLTLVKRTEIIAAIRRSMLAHAAELADEAARETGLGRAEDKVIKNRLVTSKTPGPEVLVPITYTGDRGLTLLERAPYGVIGSITPTTNPTSTIICNTIGMLAAGNAVVFNVHPNARRVSIRNVALLNEAILSAGGPANLVNAIPEPTIETATELMRHPGVRLLVVTGGAAVVKAAMTSGKRAICAGPGNPPVVVDETADLAQAAHDVVRGASFDNNVICVDEKETFVVERVADAFLHEMARNDAVVLSAAQLKQLERVVFSEVRGPRKPGVMNKELIGKNAATILEKIGLRAAASVRLVVCDVPVDHPLIWTEQMMPVMPVARVRSADEGIDLARQAEHGFGHSAAMHSRNIDALSRMAREINTSIFVKNAPIYAGLGEGGEGYCSFSIASPTGEGLTDPRSFSRERRCVLVDHFRIV